MEVENIRQESSQFGEYFDYEINGVEGYSAVLADAAFEVSQLEPGRLQGHHTRLRLPEFEISWVQTNLALRGRGSLPVDAWTVSLVLKTEGRSLQHGTEVETGSMVVHAPGAVHDGVYGQHFSVVCFGVSRAVFEQRLQREFPGLHDILDKSWNIFSLSEQNTTKLIALFEDAVELLRTDESMRNSAIAINALVDDLLYGYLLTLLEAERVSAHEKVINAASIMRTAEQLVHDSSIRSLSVGDLCESVGVPRRTLNRAFEETVGMGPATYLRRMRLNAARNSIRDSNGNTISEIAASHRFWHFGRFAEQYREMFGELPSASKSRSTGS